MEYYFVQVRSAWIDAGNSDENGTNTLQNIKNKHKIHNFLKGDALLHVPKDWNSD